MKKGLMAIFVMLIIVPVVLFAAGQGEGKSEDETVTINVLHAASLEADLMAEQIPRFEEATGIKVSLDIAPRADIPAKTMRSLIEGQGVYDVVYGTGITKSPGFVRQGKYIPIQDYMDPEELDLFISAKNNLVDPRTGKVAGLPQYNNWEMLFYRKDLLEDPAEQAAFQKEYGRELTVPTTWSEMSEVAEFFHRPPEMYGFALGMVDWSLLTDFSIAAIGHGVNFGDQDGNLTLNTPEMVQSMEELIQMTEFNPPGMETLSFFDADELMQDGRIFAYHTYTYIWETYAANHPEVGMAEPIGKGSSMGGWVGYIPDSTPHPAEAAEFVKFIGSYDIQLEQLAKLGNIPARSDVFDDPSAKNYPSIDILVKPFEYAEPWPISWPDELTTGIHEAFFKVYYDEMTASEAMDWLQNERFAGRRAME